MTGPTPEQPQAQAWEAKRRAALERVERNADGTVIVRLVEPIQVGGETNVGRVTVRRVKVRDHRHARARDFDAEVYADLLVSPEGAYNELASETDSTAVLLAVGMQIRSFNTGAAGD